MPSIQAAIKSILVDPNIDGSTYPVLTLIAGGGFHYVYETKDDQVLDDLGYEIPWLYETGYTTNENGELYTFAALALRAALSKDPGATTNYIRISITPLDDTGYTAVRDLVPDSRPKKWYTVVANIVNEQVRLRLEGANQVLINKLTLFVSKRAEARPRD